MSNSTMHICFVALDYPSQTRGGGVGSQIQTLAQHLVRAGHAVSVVALSEPGLSENYEDCGVKVYPIRRGNIHWYISKLPILGQHLVLPIRELEYSWASYHLVRHLHRTHPIDVFEGTETGTFWLSLCIWWIPLIIRLHGEVYTFHKYTPELVVTFGLRLSRLIQRFAIRRAALLIAPSNAHAREIAVELGERCRHIEVIPNTMPLPSNDRNMLNSAEVSWSNAPYILYVGRLERLKGISVLLDAAHVVVQAFPHMQFLLAGGNHPSLLQSDLDLQVSRLDLAGNVHFLGHVPREQISALYQQAILTVLPSYYETFGLAALESMAFGIPVVTTNVGGLPEVVEHGISGLLVPPGNAQALAEALIELLDDSTLRRSFGKAARERVRSKFDIEHYLSRTIDVYKQARTKAPAFVDTCEHIFFSPHCDDVVLSCGGLIASLIDQHSNVRVVTVFAGWPEYSKPSAYMRHLLAKWDLPRDKVGYRVQEDQAALTELGVQHVEHWIFDEAPCRRDSHGNPLHASYAELRGTLAPEDQLLFVSIFAKVGDCLKDDAGPKVLYFPLSLGQHVDHQLLFHVGVRLQALGYSVQFYEEWPYVQSYALTQSTNDWFSRRHNISIDPKISAASKYISQMHGLGGSREALAKRLQRFANDVGSGHAQERYWIASQQLVAQLTETMSPPTLPFVLAAQPPALRDFKKFVQTLRWRNLAEILPVGEGCCIDIGCGNGRHRDLIQQRGYQWIGLDIHPSKVDQLLVKADLQQLPYQSRHAAAVVAWQVLEYAEQPQDVIAEVARVLEPGGVFCGSISFLEPMHGRNFYNISHLALDSLLREYGFVDIQIQPGLCGFALMLWTFLRRWGGASLGQFAFILTKVWLVPVMFLRFLVSWLTWRIGLGTGYGMRWVTESAPLEFAGQLVFVARKSARSGACISDL